MVPRLTTAGLGALADQSVYMGSVEHKNVKSWLGLPKLRRNPRADLDDHRQNATVCPLASDDDKRRATEWIRDAIRKRQFAGEWPRDIWHKDADGRFWQGRLTKRGGDTAPNEYKGWPITQKEWHEIFD